MRLHSVQSPADSGKRRMWITKDGRQVLLCDMSDEHLENLFGMLERQLTEQNPTTAVKHADAWLVVVNAELEARRLKTDAR